MVGIFIGRAKSEQNKYDPKLTNSKKTEKKTSFILIIVLLGEDAYVCVCALKCVLRLVFARARAVIIIPKRIHKLKQILEAIENKNI